MTSRSNSPSVCTLAIDVGGTGIKASVLDSSGSMLVDSVRVDTPYPCPPKILIKALVELVKPLPEFERVSVGFPGYIRDDKVITAHHFGNDIWHGFNLVKALEMKFGKPVRLLNDADMQGLAAIQGKGLELVITLGTGVGTAWFRNGELMPHLELAHHPLHKGKTYNEFIGNKALQKIGKKKWNCRVQQALVILHELFHPDETYIGGGNASKISFALDTHVTLISNQDGILGGFRLWEPIQNVNSGVTPRILTPPVLPLIKGRDASRDCQGVVSNVANGVPPLKKRGGQGEL